MSSVSIDPACAMVEAMGHAEAGVLAAAYPFWLGGRAAAPNADLEVSDKYSGEVATRVAMADAAAIDAAIAAAVGAAEPMARLAAYERQAVLQHCVRRFQERFDELAFALCIEAGKPINDARGEVTRLIDTFRIAAEEAVRIGGEVLPLDISPRAEGYRACGSACRSGRAPSSRRSTSRSTWPRTRSRRRIAVGCPFVLKPASRTPLGALIIGEVLAETDLPQGRVLDPARHRDGADLFTTDERLKLLSFTGSPGVGWDLKARAGKKKVVLELGGNAAVIVDARRRPRRRGRADRLRRLLPVGPELHRRAAHPRPRRRSTTSFATAWSPSHEGARRRRSQGRATPSSAR